MILFTFGILQNFVRVSDYYSINFLKVRKSSSWISRYHQNKYPYHYQPTVSEQTSTLSLDDIHKGDDFHFGIFWK